MHSARLESVDTGMSQRAQRLAALKATGVVPKTNKDVARESRNMNMVVLLEDDPAPSTIRNNKPTKKKKGASIFLDDENPTPVIIDGSQKQGQKRSSMGSDKKRKKKIKNNDAVEIIDDPKLNLPQFKASDPKLNRFANPIETAAQGREAQKQLDRMAQQGIPPPNMNLAGQNFGTPPGPGMMMVRQPMTVAQMGRQNAIPPAMPGMPTRVYSPQPGPVMMAPVRPPNMSPQPGPVMLPTGSPSMPFPQKRPQLPPPTPESPPPWKKKKEPKLNLTEEKFVTPPSSPEREMHSPSPERHESGKGYKGGKKGGKGKGGKKGGKGSKGGSKGGTPDTRQTPGSSERQPWHKKKNSVLDMLSQASSSVEPPPGGRRAASLPGNMSGIRIKGGVPNTPPLGPKGKGKGMDRNVVKAAQYMASQLPQLPGQPPPPKMQFSYKISDNMPLGAPLPSSGGYGSQKRSESLPPAPSNPEGMTPAEFENYRQACWRQYFAQGGVLPQNGVHGASSGQPPLPSDSNGQSGGRSSTSNPNFGSTPQQTPAERAKSIHNSLLGI